jgi:hypothetical protein
MALAVYFVLRGEDCWAVRFEDRHYGHDSLTSALRAAIAAARASADHGHEAQVLVRWPDNSWAVTWTSEEDYEAAEGSGDESPSPSGEGFKPSPGRAQQL